MTYSEFLKNIDDYVGYIVEFTAVWTATGKHAGKYQRYVWDNKEFGEPSKDALMKVVNVDIIRKAPQKRTETGICYF